MSGPPRRVVPRKRASDGANIEVPITQIRKDDNYTPLERQVLQLKAENPGMLLLVEVGYKMKFFEQDARIASQVLNIACYTEKNLVTAMVPVARVHFHIKRLIAQGYKVGVSRQTETRALKAASGAMHKPFNRKVTAVYTSSTWIDDVSSPDQSAEQVICAITEPRPGSLALVAIDMPTSTITYDNWEDGLTRDALRTRLAHLAPRELVFSPASINGVTRHHIQLYKMETAFLVRLESCDKVCPLDALLQGNALAWILSELSYSVQDALAMLCTHLRTYNMTSAFQHVDNYASFTSRSCMLLSSVTMEHLELLQNATDHQVHGSLLWLLDECITPMGRRLLRQWIRHPLIDAKTIQARADAISLLRECRSQVLLRAIALLTNLPDLMRGLTRIMHLLVEPSELATILLALHRVTLEFDPSVSTGNSLLDSTIWDLSAARAEVRSAVEALSIPHARRCEKDKLYTDPSRYPLIQEWHSVLDQDEKAFEEHLLEVRRILKRPSLIYARVSDIDHLIEVRTGDVSHVPAEWIRISGTKKSVRFHTPEIVRLQRRRDQHREMLASVASDAFRDFVSKLTLAYVPLRRVVQALATLDALASLARVASRPGFVRPHVHQHGHMLRLVQFRHPVTEACAGSYVPNDVSLGGDHDPRGMIFTGSNMGGKSSAMRAVALVVLLAQLGSYVPCKEAHISCRDSICTRMGARDDIVRGKSTFMVEACETAYIWRSSTPRSLVLLDEFGRGTSTFDGTALAYAILSAFAERGALMPLLLFTTHYVSLTRLAHVYPQLLVNVHMRVEVECLNGEEKIVFLHRLVNGAASKSFGIHIAAMAGIPKCITKRAHEKSLALEDTHKSAERTATYADIVKAIYRQDTSKFLEAVQSLPLI